MIYLLALPEPKFYGSAPLSPFSDSGNDLAPQFSSPLVQYSSSVAVSSDPWGFGPNKDSNLVSETKRENTAPDNTQRRSKSSSVVSNASPYPSNSNSGSLRLLDGDDTKQFQLDLEFVSIKESSEKGGMVFKHINYEVFNNASFLFII
ncbi:hypothetical protein AYI69_g1869 [Smittium culicis]|uniref:Uncharacterized protein n=1 Tax=Smittium culicis TaxID=133412 RepID=A0A1R1YP26_9FUNG|nr:hypothetical protein AYI69_g1869 [Smittium culicis]